MKKYCTFVKNAEESRKVQEALFKAGFRWHYGSDKVQNTHMTSLWINHDGKGELTYSHDSTWAAIELRGDRKHVVIKSPNEILADPFQLDGAKQPETQHIIRGNEYSESTIHAALQAYVS